MSPRTPAPRAARPASTPGIRRGVLLAAAPFGARLGAPAVSRAIAGGLRAGGLEEVDECPLPADGLAGESVPAMLEALDFHERMLASRALIVAAERLEERTLAGSAVFELATRARQSGVPAYAIAAHDELDAFDARILDLQVILQAASARTLQRAGAELARYI